MHAKKNSRLNLALQIQKARIVHFRLHLVTSFIFHSPPSNTIARARYCAIHSRNYHGKCDSHFHSLCVGTVIFHSGLDLHTFYYLGAESTQCVLHTESLICHANRNVPFFSVSCIISHTDNVFLVMMMAVVFFF